MFLDYDDFSSAIQCEELIDLIEQQQLNNELFEMIERDS